MLIGLIGPIVPTLIAFTTRDETLFYIMNLIAQITSSWRSAPRPQPRRTSSCPACAASPPPLSSSAPP
jgi:hypothetical protein